MINLIYQDLVEPTWRYSPECHSAVRNIDSHHRHNRVNFEVYLGKSHKAETSPEYKGGCSRESDPPVVHGNLIELGIASVPILTPNTA